jgi:hypothetical protein
MSVGLIKQTKSGFKKNIKVMFKNTWSFSSILMSLVLIFGEATAQDIPLLFSLFFNLFMSAAFGFATACSATFPLACISIFQYSILKQKIMDNEHMRSSTFGKVNQRKSTLNKISEFFLGVEKVNIVELNGKKLSQPLRAILLYKLKDNQLDGSVIQLPIGCFYIPHLKVESSSSKKAA